MWLRKKWTKGLIVRENLIHTIINICIKLRECNDFVYFDNYVDIINVSRKYIKSWSLNESDINLISDSDSYTLSYKRKIMLHVNDEFVPVIVMLNLHTY